MSAPPALPCDPAAPFVLLDDARTMGAGRARLYRDPLRIVRADTLAQVPAALEALAAAGRAGLHAAGFLAYEAGLALVPGLAGLALPAAAGPLLWFGLFERVCLLPSGAVPGLLPDSREGACGSPVPLLSRPDYDRAITVLLDYIRAGDIYQANFTFPCAVAASGDPLALYAAVRPRAAAGFGALLRHEEGHLLSFSPELFFDLAADGRIETRPMKGTAPRDADPAADRALAAALAADPKQRAENLMIVDLLRNDLARVCVAGSVRVPALFRVERYPTVHQMISVVEGRLAPGAGPVDALRALFPCGSITGAPKRRAMEIIAATERTPRGAYTGAIGCIGPDGGARFNVAIRTLAMHHGDRAARLGLGSGIVADSMAGAEWDECLAKGRFLAGPEGWAGDW